MGKKIVAQKCKDGWYVQIIDSRTLHSESEVRQLMAQSGLRKRIELDKDGKIATADVVHIVAT
jgi:hypothetical protein